MPPTGCRTAAAIAPIATDIALNMVPRSPLRTAPPLPTRSGQVQQCRATQPRVQPLFQIRTQTFPGSRLRPPRLSRIALDAPDSALGSDGRTRSWGSFGTPARRFPRHRRARLDTDTQSPARGLVQLRPSIAFKFTLRLVFEPYTVYPIPGVGLVDFFVEPQSAFNSGWFNIRLNSHRVGIVVALQQTFNPNPWRPKFGRNILNYSLFDSQLPVRFRVELQIEESLVAHAMLIDLYSALDYSRRSAGQFCGGVGWILQSLSCEDIEYIVKANGIVKLRSIRSNFSWLNPSHVVASIQGNSNSNLLRTGIWVGSGAWAWAPWLLYLGLGLLDLGSIISQPPANLHLILLVRAQDGPGPTFNVQDLPPLRTRAISSTESASLTRVRVENVHVELKYLASRYIQPAKRSLRSAHSSSSNSANLTLPLKPSLPTSISKEYIVWYTEVEARRIGWDKWDVGIWERDVEYVEPAAETRVLTDLAASDHTRRLRGGGRRRRVQVTGTKGKPGPSVAGASNCAVDVGGKRSACGAGNESGLRTLRDGETAGSGGERRILAVRVFLRQVDNALLFDFGTGRAEMQVERKKGCTAHRGGEGEGRTLRQRARTERSSEDGVDDTATQSGAGEIKAGDFGGRVAKASSRDQLARGHVVMQASDEKESRREREREQRHPILDRRVLDALFELIWRY
ncbi:hypothetical protein DFH06DRAFT_1131623 [Mycena polygramma]|nr:hypothetical protein DFH06DRAFT_1131623 [Mycena polygramma]